MRRVTATHEMRAGEHLWADFGDVKFVVNDEEFAADKLRLRREKRREKAARSDLLNRLFADDSEQDC